MRKLLLDANVLFTAAHNPHGKAAFLFDAANLGHWRLLSSAYAIEEARRNIAAKCPQCSERLEVLVSEVKVAPQPATPQSLVIALPEKDMPVFLAACAAGASHLLTGDLKHFGPHMNRPADSMGLMIQTVADFLKEL